MSGGLGSAGTRADLGLIYNHLGMLCRATGQSREAESSFNQAIELLGAVTEDMARLSRAARVDPHEVDQQGLGQNEEDSGDSQDDVEQQVDMPGMGGDALGQPPADERRHDKQTAGGGHHHAKQNAPPLAHE